MGSLVPALLALVTLAPPGERAAPKSTNLPLPTALREPRDLATLLTAPDRRLRATDKRVQALIERGVRRSRTFAGLLSRLDRTDVIAYVEISKDLPAVIAGRLLLVTGVHGQRYLRIQLGTGGTDDDAVATLAHELQHAIEISTFPDVRTQTELADLYKRIGQPGVGQHTYDTRDAQATGRRVKRELES